MKARSLLISVLIPSGSVGIALAGCAQTGSYSTDIADENVFDDRSREIDGLLTAKNSA
ncbi:MAG: hypothetical protein ACM3TN_11740 [Alphaproteobacteria bacterium]